MTSATNATRADELARVLEDVQAARSVAVRVLALTDDPHAQARHLAEAIETDPLLTAQILKLANSAAFGMSGRVSSTQTAVSVLGFSAVRSVATLVAAGLRNLRHAPPEGFWQHTAAAAAGAALSAPRFGLAWGDGFALGLLHDLGTAVLAGLDPATHAYLCESGEDTAELCDRERDVFGMSHAEVIGTVLAAWSFPDPVVAAIRSHHDVVLDPSPEWRTVVAGDALGRLAFGSTTGDEADRLVGLGFDADAIEAAVIETRGRAGEVLASLPR